MPVGWCWGIEAWGLIHGIGVRGKRAGGQGMLVLTLVGCWGCSSRRWGAQGIHEGCGSGGLHGGEMHLSLRWGDTYTLLRTSSTLGYG